MSGVVVVETPRASLEQVDQLGALGVATVHEAIGRRGLLDQRLRPIQPRSRMAGTAVTALCWPGDNLMIHVAVEQCRPGDVLVVSTTSECHDGLSASCPPHPFAHMAREGLVIQTGVRDVAALNEMGFPVWSTGICAQGTVKATAGSVDVPIFIGGEVVRPGDAIVADDDGVLRVDRGEVPAALDASRARAAKEEQTRAALAGGQLCLDRYELRPLLGRLGVRYVPYGAWSGDE